MSDLVPTSPYSVTLTDAGHVPPSVRFQAELRYVKTLERQLGGAEQVAASLRAMQAANDGGDEFLTASERELAKLWPRAADAANQAGFEKLGDLYGAHFDVRLN